jgi:VIT1/CCC1 family predicted Fe2+/Mn2+ transporter
MSFKNKQSYWKYGKYLRDVIYGANDGIITTFAVVAGVYGASLDNFVIIALGFANLLADGISMASSSYLGYKSESEIEQNLKNEGIQFCQPTELTPSKNSFVTFISFILAGFFPLIPFLLPFQYFSFLASIIFTFLTLFIIGSLRSIFIKKFWALAGLEMLVIGGLAALAAYFVGYLIKILYNL